MRFVGRLLLSCAAFALAVPLLFRLFSELAIIFHMWVTNTPAPADFSEDFTFSMLLVFGVAPLTLIGAFGLAFVVWRKLGPRLAKAE